MPITPIKILTMSMLFFGCVSRVFALSNLDFQTIGRKYGVSPYLLQAISLVESQDGEILGRHVVNNVVDDVQRRFLEKIAKHTGRSLAEFKGSYAGAMGHMQIMPSTFYEYAQDGDGDGIRDPLNPCDSLATAAYLLARNIALQGSLRAALKKYNNSDLYCQKVLEYYRKLELESQFASR
jgi:membrane-bound lytic murein transglycosylase B